MVRASRWVIAAFCVTLPAGLGIFVSQVDAQTGSVASTTIRPFVTALIPVVGAGGAIGGVHVDAKGVVSRAEVSESLKLHEAWKKASKIVPAELNRSSRMRMVSLPRLEAAIADCIEKHKPLPQEMLFLAGLQRVEYVFVFPDRSDIVLAGPAEGWKPGRRGAVVGIHSGRPALRLDDLLEALVANGDPATASEIACSIDPTAEGISRLQRLVRSRSLALNAQTIRQMENAIGPQLVSISGVHPRTHFARVLVSADFMMKRLAMGFEESPVGALPSYMDMLKTTSGRRPGIESPRWWMAANYDALVRDSTGMAWQLRGPGVQTLTEDGYLGESGRVVGASRKNSHAEQWAARMTENYKSLADAIPVFGELRNCMDLSVVGALIAAEGLRSRAGCDLPLLMDRKRIRGLAFPIPKTVDSRASVIRARRGWIVSVSGGVDINPWQVVVDARTDEKLAAVRSRVAEKGTATWWWD